MKQPLFILNLISLLSAVSPSFAMLDDPLAETYWDPEKKILLYKELIAKDLNDPRATDERYKGRSKINGWDYPKVPMIHPYNYTAVEDPFTAALTYVDPPHYLKGLVDHYLSDHQVLYFFNVQTLKPNRLNRTGQKLRTSPNDPFTLRPHYFVHPDAPEFFRGKDYKTSLKWTVIPGIESCIEPLSGGLGLHSNDIQTHNSGDSDKSMGVSPNSMHLKGIEKIDISKDPSYQDYRLTKHQDCYSLVAFTDDETKEKIVVITYHWLLTIRDWVQNGSRFCEVLDKARTFRELIEGRRNEFEGIGAYPSFAKLVGELKQYVGLTSKIKKNDEKKEVIIKPTLPSPKVIPEPKIESKSRNMMNSFKTVSFNLDSAFGSGRAKDKAQEIKREGKTIKVITDNNAEASYQLESERFSVKPGEKISIPYEIIVEAEGKMSLGLLRTDTRGWYGKELFLNAGIHTGVYNITVPEGETEASLVFRNAHFQRNGGPGQTTFTIKDINILKEEIVKPVAPPSKIASEPKREVKSNNVMSSFKTVSFNLDPALGSGRAKNKAQEITREGNTIKVTTDNNAEASYQLESERFPVTSGEKISIPYEITVEAGGKMSLGLLNTKTTGWYGQQLFLNAGIHKGVYNVTVPESEREASLVLRNGHLKTPGQTIFTIKSVEILKKDSRERN